MDLSNGDLFVHTMALWNDYGRLRAQSGRKKEVLPSCTYVVVCC